MNNFATNPIQKFSGARDKGRDSFGKFVGRTPINHSILRREQPTGLNGCPTVNFELLATSRRKFPRPLLQIPHAIHFADAQRLLPFAAGQPRLHAQCFGLDIRRARA